MTIKEQIQFEEYYAGSSDNFEDSIISIVEQTAIKFADWLLINNDFYAKKSNYYITSKELFELFKKENNL